MSAARSRTELLSPAGSMESLIAAVRSGADAVYLGAEDFSARSSAANFDREALREAVEYCHLAGVDVHLAVNTVLFDEELPEALALVQYACSLPVDAVIVQDWGLFSLLRRAAPELPIHCSTQMTVHTPAGAVLMERLGAARIVLARELSLDEIREIRGAVQAEIEHFVHGALCMCVSGQCYFSAMLGSRSGNRGSCAQPCRLPFASVGGTGHDLSLKDYSMLERIRELADAGVDSCKIEGRMKRPEYVAAATTAGRTALDGGKISGELMSDLEAVFSRQGFTTGYPDARRGRDMFGIRTKEDVTAATGGVLQSLRGLYQRERQRVPVGLELTGVTGQAVRLRACDRDGHTVSVSGPVLEKARESAIDPQRCRKQLEKTGGTVFYAEDCTVSLDPDGTLPVSALNRMRRDALEEIAGQRKKRPALPFEMPELQVPAHEPDPGKLRMLFHRVDSGDRIPDEAAECELVFVPLFTELSVIRSLLDRGLPVGIDLPRVFFGREQLVRDQLLEVRSLGIGEGRCGNIGGIPLLQEAGMRIHGGFSLNVTNSSSLLFFERLGLADLELSPEITLRQADRIGGSMRRGLLTYGRLPMMVSRNCPAANHPDACRGCVNTGGNRPARVRDRRDIDFPVQCERKGGIHVFNSVPIVMSDRRSALGSMDFETLLFTVENPVEIVRILRAYQEGTELKTEKTRGLYQRGVE